MYDLNEEKERVILVAVCTDDIKDTEISLDELAELAKTAGAEVVGRVIQNREGIHPGYYVGTGKTDEIRELADETKADSILCDDELSPAQMKNLEADLNLRVLDRTLIILEIFAMRARSAEGKLQVELAQQKYRLSHLVGMHKELSRLGGGIGTRGPGEKKLEVDRRAINSRISRLREEIEEVKKNREVTRNRRGNSVIPTVAIVGYTNAGKSTLLNRLTDAGVLEENALFATLDPTTRSYTMKNHREVLFTDTVGFINKLPHHLVDAFKSTFEEAKYADIIVHVADASDDNLDRKMAVVYDTMQKLDICDKPIITVFNKTDLLTEEVTIKDLKADEYLRASIKFDENLDKLEEALEKVISKTNVGYEIVIAYADTKKLSVLQKNGNVEACDYLEDGIHVKGVAPRSILNGLEL